jgi:hypothetical protein
MDIAHSETYCSVAGNALNLEEQFCLDASILQRKTLENLSGKMLFWGKIFADNQDYIIVVNIAPNAEFFNKNFYYW